jgi:hypothetical protein
MKARQQMLVKFDHDWQLRCYTLPAVLVEVYCHGSYFPQVCQQYGAAAV